MRVSVFGIGKVGISLIASILKAGHRVTGVDTNEEVVSNIKEKAKRFEEPHVQDLLERYSDKLEVTTDAGYAISNSEVSFVIVPTLSNQAGGFSNQYILESINSIGECLRKKPSFHTVAVVSTVVPGSSNHEIIPLLEETSRKTVGESIGYCYNPLFIAQGEIVKGIVTPDYILIGEACRRSGDILEGLHKDILDSDSPIVRMNTTEAEITKLASNTHETMRVSFANMLAQTCNEIPGTSVDNVTNALSFRLGKRFFKGATPYGGPCWPRDNIALSSLLEIIGLQPLIPTAVHNFNNYHSSYLTEKIQSLVNKGNNTIGLLGLAYKTGTPLVDEAFTVRMVENLQGKDLSFTGYDPLAGDSFKQRLADYPVTITDNPEACLQQSICLLLQPLSELENLDFLKYKDCILIDYWRVIPESIHQQLPNYYAFGVGRETEKSKLFPANLRKLTDQDYL